MCIDYPGCQLAVLSDDAARLTPPEALVEALGRARPVESDGAECLIAIALG